MSDVLTEMPSNGDFESKDPSMVGAIGEHSPPIQSKWNNGDNLSTSKLGMMLNHMQNRLSDLADESANSDSDQLFVETITVSSPAAAKGADKGPSPRSAAASLFAPVVDDNTSETKSKAAVSVKSGAVSSTVAKVASPKKVTSPVKPTTNRYVSRDLSAGRRRMEDDAASVTSNASRRSILSKDSSVVSSSKSSKIPTSTSSGATPGRPSLSREPSSASTRTPVSKTALTKQPSPTTTLTSRSSLGASTRESTTIKSSRAPSPVSTPRSSTGGSSQPLSKTTSTSAAGASSTTSRRSLSSTSTTASKSTLTKSATQTTSTPTTTSQSRRSLSSTTATNGATSRSGSASRRSTGDDQSDNESVSTSFTKRSVMSSSSRKDLSNTTSTSMKSPSPSTSASTATAGSPTKKLSSSPWGSANSLLTPRSAVSSNTATLKKLSPSPVGKSKTPAVTSTAKPSSSSTARPGLLSSKSTSAVQASTSSPTKPPASTVLGSSGRGAELKRSISTATAKSTIASATKGSANKALSVSTALSTPRKPAVPGSGAAISTASSSFSSSTQVPPTTPKSIMGGNATKARPSIGGEADHAAFSSEPPNLEQLDSLYSTQSVVSSLKAANIPSANLLRTTIQRVDTIGVPSTPNPLLRRPSSQQQQSNSAPNSRNGSFIQRSSSNNNSRSRMDSHDSSNSISNVHSRDDYTSQQQDAISRLPTLDASELGDDIRHVEDDSDTDDSDSDDGEGTGVLALAFGRSASKSQQSQESVTANTQHNNSNNSLNQLAPLKSVRSGSFNGSVTAMATQRNSFTLGGASPFAKRMSYMMQPSPADVASSYDDNDHQQDLVQMFTSVDGHVDDDHAQLSSPEKSPPRVVQPATSATTVGGGGHNTIKRTTSGNIQRSLSRTLSKGNMGNTNSSSSGSPMNVYKSQRGFTSFVPPYPARLITNNHHAHLTSAQSQQDSNGLATGLYSQVYMPSLVHSTPAAISAIYRAAIARETTANPAR